VLTPNLIILNNWRLYFKVYRLSDICNAEGNKILKQYLTFPSCETNDRCNETNLQWPFQMRPNREYFNAWKRTTISCLESSTTESIRRKLGEWITPINRSQQNLKAYVHIPIEEVFIPITEGALKGYFKHITASSKGTNSMAFMANSTMRITKKIPELSIPADIYHNDRKYVVKHHRGVNRINNTIYLHRNDGSISQW
jgi:hypothetical protein